MVLPDTFSVGNAVSDTLHHKTLKPADLLQQIRVPQVAEGRPVVVLGSSRRILSPGHMTCTFFRRSD